MTNTHATRVRGTGLDHPTVRHLSHNRNGRTIARITREQARSTAATDRLTNLLASFGIDAGRADLGATLLIDEFDYWHNRAAALVAPTTICWFTPSTSGHAA